jgi:hypothetical protein
MLKRFLLSLTFIILSNSLATAQQRPLITDDIDTTPPGTIEIAAGTDFLQNQRFPLSGLKGDLTRVGDIRIRTGYAGNVEVQIEGVIQNFLAIDSQNPNPSIPLDLNGNSTNDFGDIKTSVKVRLRNESKNLPALGFKFGFQIPNSDQSKGIGTNQIDLFSKIIVQKKFGKEKGKSPKLNVFGNLGVGIMSAPLDDFTQNDVLLYGLAGIYRATDNINIASEVNGRVSTRGSTTPLGTESQGQFRLGTQIKASGLRFDTAAIFGLTKNSPKTGITFGVTYQSPQIFKPAQ